MEVWDDLTLRGTGSLTTSGSQCAIHVSQALAVDGCTVDARADGADVTGEVVAGVIAGDMAVRGGGRVVAVGAAPTAGVRAYGVYLQDAGTGVGSAGCRLSVDASWPEGATAPAGETDGREVSGGAGEPAGGAGTTVERPDTGSATDPVLKPATTTPRTAATTKTTVAKSTASTPSRAKTASAATATLPKTANNNWIAASLALFLLGTALLGRPKRKGD